MARKIPIKFRRERQSRGEMVLCRPLSSHPIVVTTTVGADLGSSIRSWIWLCHSGFVSSPVSQCASCETRKPSPSHPKPSDELHIGKTMYWTLFAWTLCNFCDWIITASLWKSKLHLVFALAKSHWKQSRCNQSYWHLMKQTTNQFFIVSEVTKVVMTMSFFIVVDLITVRGGQPHSQQAYLGGTKLLPVIWNEKSKCKGKSCLCHINLVCVFPKTVPLFAVPKQIFSFLVENIDNCMQWFITKIG